MYGDRAQLWVHGFIMVYFYTMDLTKANNVFDLWGKQVFSVCAEFVRVYCVLTNCFNRLPVHPQAHVAQLKSSPQ